MANGPFSGKVEINDIPAGTTSPQPTITLDGNSAHIVAGGHGYHGRLALHHAADKETAVLNAMTGDLTLGGNGVDGDISLRNEAGTAKIFLTASTPGQQFSSGPTITLRSGGLSAGHETMSLKADGPSLTLSNIVSGKNTVFLGGMKADLFLGGAGQHGSVTLRNGFEADTIHLDGQTGSIALNLSNNGSVVLKNSSGAEIVRVDSIPTTSADPSLPLGGQSGRIVLKNFQGHDSLILNGGMGDIFCQNADCAEDFDVSHSGEVEPGTVVVIDEEGKLRPSQQPYDKKVAGVISGAGNCRPGLILDKKESQSDRLPVALVGKVYCKVDARYSAIEVGDLLTTSSTPGHAMKADEPLKAFGAVIGKALRPLTGGQDLIPILIALQ